MKLHHALATIAAITIATGGAAAQAGHHGNPPSPTVIGHHSSANPQAREPLPLPLPLPTLSLPSLPGLDGPPTCC